MFLIITLIALLAGILIGTIGIGGVILAPLLSLVLGIDLHIAISACSFSYLFPGTVGTLTYAQKGSIEWDKVLWLSIGIIPAALLPVGHAPERPWPEQAWPPGHRHLQRSAPGPPAPPARTDRNRCRGPGLPVTRSG